MYSRIHGCVADGIPSDVATPSPQGTERSDWVPCPMIAIGPQATEIALCFMAISQPETYHFSGCPVCGLTYREVHASILKER